MSARAVAFSLTATLTGLIAIGCAHSPRVGADGMGGHRGVHVRLVTTARCLGELQPCD